ncbi:1,4-alpha-glucan branching enzyme [Balneicella halophila]|uniref:1,4-alpha-glucan branching enzyme n=1 Tax=Balneicella halophila TaxID=1537566 RepID=A0A7L4UPM1_BALHA|nr:alpha amylase C-terminal domain-containing protein [Balneicella halophila]PVX51081.1 1,4-alpha-glucan branching enzyme [Balneicella halophila]
MLELIKRDTYLQPYQTIIEQRHDAYSETKKNLTKGTGDLASFALGYLYYGMHEDAENYIFREWAPNATEIFLKGDFNNWEIKNEYRFEAIGDGNWELKVPKKQLKHKQLYKLQMVWDGGEGERLPAYVRRVVQNEDTKVFDAQIWIVDSYNWQHKTPDIENPPLIYEAHIGMAGEEPRVSSYNEFRENVLPRIKKLGYNTLQLMAIQEHPYYGSFGYHVSNFFACSSRFGTPEDLKMLIDEAHGMGIQVIMDIVHSHAVKNTTEGLGLYDGTPYQFFHEGVRREHIAWDSLCFDYGKDQVIHFLLSNVQYWMQEFHFDGFRFDGVTSMLYLDHGLGRDFTGYHSYFDGGQDDDAIIYLKLANELVHEINPKAITIAEEMSGMPGLASPIDEGGIGFDYRMAMGVPDFWIKLIKEVADENWQVGHIFYELTNKRAEEKVISYAESHDQALVGDKTIIFRLIDKEMYYHMDRENQNLLVDRGMALHKIIRLITLATAGGGYLNFMGNEFGHPEWIDFPRYGNDWSYNHARRQWSLADDDSLRFQFLQNFDNAMIHLVKEHHTLREPFVNKIWDNQGDQVLAFIRGNLLFVFNFNPLKSFPDYGMTVPAARYQLILSSDEKRFGGYDLVEVQKEYAVETPEKLTKGDYRLKIYIPARTALVFQMRKSKSVEDLG